MCLSPRIFLKLLPQIKFKMEEIRWGIIGCGDVTEVKSGPAFNKVPNSRLIAVMRRDAEKAKDYAQRHNVPKWYDDANLLIEDPEINSIYIATPPLNHEDYTIRALAAGKFVYVEKPMTLNTESAKRMAHAVEKYKGKLTVAHYRRAQPLFLKVSELLKEKVIGSPLFIRLDMLQAKKAKLIANTAENWRINPSISGGGLFHDLAPHQLDLMVFYFGDAKKFSGISVNQNKHTTIDDMVTGQILFENDIVFNGNWCFNVTEANELDLCQIYGTDGKISFSVFGNEITLESKGTEVKYCFERLQHVQQPMIEKVVQYFLGHAENPCTAEEAIKSMQLMDAFTNK